MGIFSIGSKVNNLDADLFAEKINQHENAVILDVRTHEEYRSERIPNSVLIDIYKPDFLENIEKLDRSKSYFVYCRSGNRSYMAANEMMRMGFVSVFNLQNGIISWEGDVERGQ